ncbi:hypothetical protein [Klebsiella pneumoniae]|uniref:hypothetical protein n=1 Tax=Klebsiella pneumoniae TaxID=573 RepID=UPI0013309EBF|nr:hypothetical protein [Klebsiella pneumoniae]
MTTDITELAQRMSIERIKQIALGGTPTMGERESLAITALHFAEELKIATDAFQAAGLAQLAAEEALEKAQQRIAELDAELEREREKSRRVMSRIAELEQKHCGGALMERELAHSQVINKLMSEIDNRDSRIAELEALKEKRLPNPYAYLRENDGQIQISIGAERPSDRSGGYATPWFAIYTDAGIKVEAE